MEHVVECQYLDSQRFLVQASTQRSAGTQDVSLRRLHALCLQQGTGVERGAAQGGSELPDLVQELVGASSPLLPGWKAENSWLAETYSQCLQQAMKDLFSAFKRFFDGDAKFPKSTRSSSRRTPSAIRRTSRLMKPGGRSCSRALAGCGIAGAASSKASPRTSP